MPSSLTCKFPGLEVLGLIKNLLFGSIETTGDQTLISDLLLTVTDLASMTSIHCSAAVGLQDLEGRSGVNIATMQNPKFVDELRYST